VSYLKSAFWCVLLIQLSACAWIASFNGEPDVIAKPLSDQREFRYTTLDNGLRVLLVSDPGADKAAASLDVNVGSRQDPQDYQGLAHFLEHMLFLGTEKYPNAGDYQAFISSHGGSHNAFTSFEDTNYFFDISADSLEPALDQFAQFFVGPLFNAEYVAREVNAVNSEYRARIRDDRRRELAVFKAQVNPEHPFAKFSVGNLDTLHSDKEQALRDQLLSFYRQNYSANIMTLTVIGRESLDDLAAMVLPKFAGVKNTDRQLDDIKAPLFSSGTLPRWINIEPVQNRRSLSINFPVPDAEPHWRSKPLNYIGNILGHEGEGSLLAVLKARGWAENLSAGQSLDYQGGGMFGVDVALTEVGLKYVDDIVAMVFASIQQLRSEGLQAWRYAEQAGLAEQQFMFRAQSAPINEVVQLSMAMQQYPAAEILRGPYVMAEYKPELLAKFLAAMKPENSFITVVAPGAKTSTELARYQVRYGQRNVSASQLAALRSKASSELSLPGKNDFIATDFSLKRGGKTKPEKLSSSPVELWLHTDDVFELPKGRVYLLLESELASSDAGHRVKTELWLRMVKDQLNELTYPAKLAGLDFDLDVTWRGIQVSVDGYSQKQGELLAEVLAVLKSPDWQQGRFDRLKSQRLRQFENARRQSPYQQVIAELPRMINNELPGLMASETASRSASMVEIQQHVAAVLADLRLRMLVDGNFDRSDAQQLAAVVQKALPLAQSPNLPAQHVARLDKGIAARAVPAEHDDSAVLLYLQSAMPGLSARVAMGLTAQMLSADFYHQLRTEKQLGYVVSASVYPQREVGGMIFLVQSPTVDAASIQSEIATYLSRWLQKGLNEADFNQHKSALLKRLAEQPENFWEAADRHWQDLLDAYMDFNSREHLTSALKQLSFVEWKTIVQRDLGTAGQRALLVYTAGKWPDALPTGRPVGEPETFTTQDSWYRFE
jgi:secreted Zn-dependent insulinase-like peptidase